MTKPCAQHDFCPFENCPSQLPSSEVRIWNYTEKARRGNGGEATVEVLKFNKNNSKTAGMGATVLRHTAGRIDALLLKIPSLIWVGLLQSTKIAIKFVACVITLNQSKHISQDWSFSGLERDTAMLMLFAKKTYLAAKDVIFAPKHNYKPSGLELFEGLGHVFGGDYHIDIRHQQVLTGETPIEQLISADASYSGKGPF